MYYNGVSDNFIYIYIYMYIYIERERERRERELFEYTVNIQIYRVHYLIMIYKVLHLLIIQLSLVSFLMLKLFSHM